jgi:hypothetical protein
MVWGVNWVEGQHGTHNLTLNLASVWDTKIIENSQENHWFRGSMGMRDSADSQNLSLNLGSIWAQKSLKIHRELKGLGGQWG